MHDIIDAFRKAMREAGIHYTGEIVPDAPKTLYFAQDDSPKHKKNCWYVLHTDGIAAGAFGSYKDDISVYWCSRDASQLTPEEKRAFAQKSEAIKKQRESEQQASHQRAAEHAQMVWDAAEPANGHPYLTRKQIQACGARVGRWTRINQDTGEVWLDIPDSLIIPIRDGKKLASLQAIFPSADNKMKRDKDFLSGGKKWGCFHVIGKPSSEPNTTIVICEGFATGASIHMATGYPVIVAFDAGNLDPVTERVRRSFPLATVIIAADNDQFTEGNPGVTKATKAAHMHRAWIAVPQFANADSRPTDFNDLHCLEGLQAVQQQIQASTQESTPAPFESAPVATVQSRIVDTVSLLPDVNSKGTPRATIENLAEICRRMGVNIRYNVIKKEEEILIPGESFTVDNRANASLAGLTSWCERFGMPSGKMGDYVTYLADKNLYNPVASWIMSKPWDGKTRIPDLMRTVTAKNEDDTETLDLKETLILRWMVSAVAAAFNPMGVSAHGILVFVGDQYLGKTKWFKSLAPADFISDGVTLDPKDKDSVKQAVSNWLVELGEIDATFRKSDIAQLKSFITRDKDVFRRAYARRESEYARRTVFFGSVNDELYLRDKTGNRRYWTINCAHLDHSHNIDMQQLWAEVYGLYLQGETFYLKPDEMDLLNKRNQDFEVIDPIEERILTQLDWDEPETLWRWSTATDILHSIGLDRPTQADVTKAATFLRKKNGGHGRRSNGKSLILHPDKKINA